MIPTHQPGTEPGPTVTLFAAAAAALPPGYPLPEPWYSADHHGLECDLCRAVVDELWPLADYPADPDSALSPGELCVCRRCATAVRPPDRHHPTSHQPAA